MLEFTVQGMTCGHCVSSITKAIKEIAPHASVETNLARHVVRIEGATDAAAVEAAIREAGYTPQPVV